MRLDENRSEREMIGEREGRGRLTLLTYSLSTSSGVGSI